MAQISNYRARNIFGHLKAHPRDSKYFLSWTGIASVLGTAGIAAVGIEDVRDQLRNWFPPPVWEWGSNNKILVLVILAILTVFPILADKVMSRALLNSRELMKNIELSTAAASFSQRTAHLTTKVNDSVNGERDFQYIGHTLVECCKFFKQRAIQTQGIDSSLHVDAVLFEAVFDNSGKPLRLERKKQTHETNADFSVMINRMRNKDAGELLDGLILQRLPVGTSGADELDSLMRALKLDACRYTDFLIVPVVLDRKDVSTAGVYGALMIMAQAPQTFRADDHQMLAAYAWLCAAAISVDHVTKSVIPAKIT